MDDLIKRAREFLPRIREAYELAISCRVLTGLPQVLEQLADALEAERKARAGFEIQAQDLRDRVVQLERELATARTAHEVTAQERDKAVTELAMLRIWIEQARPVVETVREWQRARLSVLSSGVDDYASRVSDFGTAQNRIMTIALPPKETP